MRSGSPKAVPCPCTSPTAAIQLFAVRFHDAMLERLSLRPEGGGRPLSMREAQALLWSAEGLTTDATAERPGLSASAVTHHLPNARRKLGASSKHHAAIIAIRRGLI